MSSTPEPTAGRRPATPAELRERVLRRSRDLRRRRLIGSTGTLAVVAALVVSTSLVAAGSSHLRPGQVAVTARLGAADELTANVPHAPAANRALARQVARDETAFSLRLLGRLVAASPDDNALVSPSSVSTALAMLELGARGATAEGVASVLGTTGLSPDEQAEGWQSLALLLAGESSRTAGDLARLPQLDVANALFVQRSFPIRASYVRALTAEFSTGVWRVDFERDLAGATAAINSWTAEKTDGLIKQLFSKGALTNSTVLVLADAVYFAAHWAKAFGTKVTDEPFHLGSGRTIEVPFMGSPLLETSGEWNLPVKVTTSYEAVELPYVGKSLSALVVMPTKGSLSRFVASLSSTRLGEIVGGLRVAGVQVDMPTFTLRADDQLSSLLSSMGMEGAFSSGADLGGIAPLGLQVSSVEQHVYLQVSPVGTRAAAATGVAVGTAVEAGGVRIDVDHPFLFLVRDDTTGAVLFEAAVANPAG